MCEKSLSSLSWSIVLGLGQYTLNKHGLLKGFCTLATFRWHVFSRFNTAGDACGLLVKSVSGPRILEVQLECFCFPLQWKVEGLFFFSSQAFFLTVDSRMFRQHGLSLGLLGDWVPTFDSIWWLTVVKGDECSVISVEISFVSMLAKPVGVWHCTELAHYI